MSALDLAARALRAAEGDEAQALVQSERSGMARFAGSEVHQPTLIENEVVELQVVRDGRLGIASGNRTDADGLRVLAARAAEAADSAPADPDFPGLAAPADAPTVEGYDEEAAALGAEDQARLAAAAIDASDLDLYGFFTSGVTEVAVASTSGVAVSQELTDVAVLALAAVEGASGYAEQTGWRPLIATPNHPEYPAAHGSLTSAEAEIFSTFLGSGQINVDIHGFDPAGPAGNLNATRHFNSVDDLRAEIVNARLWAGVHYRFSGQAGVALGQSVAQYDLKHAFLQSKKH